MRRRIIVCLGLLFVLCLIGDAIAMLCLDRSIRHLSELVEYHRIESLRARLISDSARVEADLLAHAAGQDDSTEPLVLSTRRFAESLGQCGSCHHPPGVRAELARIGESLEAYEAVHARLVATDDPNQRETIEQEAIALAGGLAEQTTAMDDRATQHLEVRSSDAAASIHTAWLALLGTLATVLVAGGFVAFHLKRRLTRPVEALLTGIERVRAGAPPQEFEVTGDEEFRALGDALNHAHERLREAQERVLQTEKLAAVGRLVAGVAHEIGNPLASISSIAQLMRRQTSANGQAERIETLLDQVQRISRIVRDLLSFSRPPGQECYTRVELDPLLERAATLLAYDKRAERIRVVHHRGEDVHAIRGDADRLVLVFTNIILNAFDAMKGNGQGTLTITTCAEDDSVAVRFQDNGLGMTEEQLARALEPFYTTKDPGAGTGLGLWICYQVIQRHAGSIQIDSIVGRGTTVTICLPAHAASETPLEVGRVQPPPQLPA